MHELSIATSIFEAVLEVAAKHSAKRVVEVNLEIGELTLLNPDQLSMAFDLLSKGTVAEGSKLNIEVVKARAKCTKCGFEWELKISSMSPSMSHMLALTCPACDFKVYARSTCPNCGSEDYDIVRGKELVIKSIKIESCSG